MLRPRVSIPVLVVAAMLLAAVAPPAVGTTHDYDIDIDGSIDTVDRTVSTSQGEFTVTQVGRADAGDTVSVSVDAPSDSDYTITILDSEQRFRRTADATGDASREFGTGGLEPGTYAVVAGNQSTEEVYAGEPLVIRAYAVSTQAAESVELSDDLDVTVELDEVESGESIEAVEVVLADDSENLRVDASAVNDTHYSASVSTDDVDAGDYSLYAVVRGDDQALGENELIGVSDASTVEVVEQSDTSTPDGQRGRLVGRFSLRENRFGDAAPRLPGGVEPPGVGRRVPGESYLGLGGRERTVRDRLQDVAHGRTLARGVLIPVVPSSRG